MTRVALETLLNLVKSGMIDKGSCLAEDSSIVVTEMPNYSRRGLSRFRPRTPDIGWDGEHSSISFTQNICVSEFLALGMHVRQRGKGTN